MKIIKKLLKIFMWIAIVTAAGIGLILGIFWVEHKTEVTLPEPTGPYRVGRVEYDWVDSTRIEVLAPTPGVKRELTVWIWYPADSTNKNYPTVKYRPERWIAAEDSAVGVVMSDFLTSDLSLVHPHAIHGAKLSPDKPSYPVVFFKPGVGALATDYTTLCEDLASHGYIVVASDSPYSTFVVVFNDGRVVTRTREGNPGEMAEQTEAKRIAENLIPIWTADLHFELNKLEQINKNDPSHLFTGRMNLDEVGVFGHSFGGATAAQFCYSDPRCKAGIDIDGQPFGNVVQKGLHKPFLFILSEHSDGTKFEIMEILQHIHSITTGLPNWPNQITVHGAHHFNFSDMALLKEHFISKLMLGSIDKRRALFITGRYVQAFFDTYLKNIPDNLMKGASDKYPEIRIRPKEK